MAQQCCQKTKQFHETFEMNNKAANYNASDQLNQPLTALAKTKTFVWVQSKVRRQIKHVHLWKLDEAVTIRKLVTTAQT